MITAQVQGVTIHMFIGSTMAPICTGADCRYCKWQKDRDERR